MSEEPSTLSFANYVARAADRHMTVEHSSSAWARRGRMVMAVGTITFLATASYMVAAVGPAVLTGRELTREMVLSWLFCLIYLIGVAVSMWLTKQRLVLEGALLSLTMSASVMVAITWLYGFRERAFSLMMGLPILIVMAGGMLIARGDWSLAGHYAARSVSNRRI